MANVAIFKTGEDPKYLKSVNTPEYKDDPDALINPDISSVENIALKYWKRDGDTIVPMTQAEKDAVDAADLLEKKAAADNYSVGLKIALTALIKVINKRIPNNTITKTEMVQALKDEIN